MLTFSIRETVRPFFSALSSSYFLCIYDYVMWALRIYNTYIFTLLPRHCPVQKFFSQTWVASERFYWPGGNRFAFQMSWSPKRRDSETLATAWTLRLSTCMASKHKQHTHIHTLRPLPFPTHDFTQFYPFPSSLSLTLLHLPNTTFPL